MAGSDSEVTSPVAWWTPYATVDPDVKVNGYTWYEAIAREQPRIQALTNDATPKPAYQNRSGKPTSNLIGVTP